MEMADIFDEMEKQKMGFIAIRPLYQGILTDQRSDHKLLSQGDRFASAEYADDFEKRRKIVEVFDEEIAESMTSFAIRFTLATPLVASVVIGLNTPEQVKGIVGALEGKIPGTETVKKAQLLWRSQLCS